MRGSTTPIHGSEGAPGWGRRRAAGGGASLRGLDLEGESTAPRVAAGGALRVVDRGQELDGRAERRDGLVEIAPQRPGRPREERRPAQARDIRTFVASHGDAR